MVSWNPDLSLVGYDNFCNEEATLLVHAPELFRSLKGFVDRFHAKKGHIRLECHSRLHADTWDELNLFEDIELVTDGDLQKLLTRLRNPKKYAYIHSFPEHIRFGLPAAVLLEALAYKSLPLGVSFCWFLGNNVMHDIEVHIRREDTRARILKALSFQTLHVKHALKFPAGVVPKDHIVYKIVLLDSSSLVSYPQNLLRMRLSTLNNMLPFRMVIRKPIDTSKMERKWKDLNPLARTLRYTSGSAFDFVFLHVLDARNQNIGCPRQSSDK